MKHKRAAWHELAIAAFVADTRIDAVAQALGKSSRTIRRWKSQPENWREVILARSGVLESTLNRFRNAMPQLAEKLVTISTDPMVEPQVAIRAIATVFEQFGSLQQRAELEQRMTHLEQTLQLSGANRTTSQSFRPITNQDFPPMPQKDQAA